MLRHANKVRTCLLLTFIKFASCHKPLYASKMRTKQQCLSLKLRRRRWLISAPGGSAATTRGCESKKEISTLKGFVARGTLSGFNAQFLYVSPRVLSRPATPGGNIYTPSRQF